MSGHTEELLLVWAIWKWGETLPRKPARKWLHIPQPGVLVRLHAEDDMALPGLEPADGRPRRITSYKVVKEGLMYEFYSYTHSKKVWIFRGDTIHGRGGIEPIPERFRHPEQLRFTL